MAGGSGLFGTANLAAGISYRHADSAPRTDYTRKNDHPLRKRQGAEPWSRPSPIRLISRRLIYRLEHRRPLGDLVLHQGPQGCRGAIGVSRDDAAEIEQALAHALVIQ